MWYDYICYFCIKIALFILGRIIVIKAGDLINIEVDIMAKYVERLISKGVTGGK